MTVLSLILYAVAAFAAGIINTLAGGGSFLTFPALLLTGLDPRAANMTSTIALFPMQISTGYAGRKFAGDTPQVRFRALFALSLIGGAAGAGLLLLTQPAFFGKLVPWLVLFATGMFAWGSFSKKREQEEFKPRFSKHGTLFSQFMIAVYGGYFGGGIGILMLAALTLAGMSIRKAGAAKNILAAAMNASAVLIFLFSQDIGWIQAMIGIPASILGGAVGTEMLQKVNEKKLRIVIVAWGLLLTIGLCLRN
jgi:uncharacterized protein